MYLLGMTPAHGCVRKWSETLMHVPVLCETFAESTSTVSETKKRTIDTGYSRYSRSSTRKRRYYSIYGVSDMSVELYCAYPLTHYHIYYSSIKSEMFRLPKPLATQNVYFKYSYFPVPPEIHSTTC